MTEEQRIAGIQANIKQLLDDAANDRSAMGIVGLGKVWLAAELVGIVERARNKDKDNG